MTLVGRRIAHIACRRDQHGALDERQRRVQLLHVRQPGHRGAPDGLAIRDCDLRDLAVRGGRVDELPVGVRDRCRIGDLLDGQAARADLGARYGRSFIEAGGRVLPQNLAGVGVDCHGAAHVGGAEVDVVQGAVDLYAAQINEPRVDGRGNGDLLAHHRSHIGRGDLRGCRVVVGPRIAAAKGRPVRGGTGDSRGGCCLAAPVVFDGWDIPAHPVAVATAQDRSALSAVFISDPLV